MSVSFTHYGILKKCGPLIVFGPTVVEVVQWGWKWSLLLYAMDKLTDKGTTSYWLTAWQEMGSPRITYNIQKSWGVGSGTDLFLLLNDRDIDRQPWLIPFNSSLGAEQTAPTYNADYQYIVQLLPHSSEYLSTSEEDDSWSALKSRMVKPPEPVSLVWMKCTQSKATAVTESLGGLLLVKLLTNSLHFFTKPMSMAICEGQAFILKISQFSPCAFYSLNLKWETEANPINWNFHVCRMIFCCTLTSYTTFVSILCTCEYSHWAVTSITQYLFVGPQ